MQLQLTYVWFELELFAIPSQIIYYYYAYRHFQKHRKKKSMGANKFIYTMRGDLDRHRKKMGGQQEWEVVGPDATFERKGAAAGRYFFDDDTCEEDDKIQVLMYDEDQQDHFENIKNQAQMLDVAMEADKNFSLRQRGNTKSSLFQSQDFTIKNYDRSSSLSVPRDATGQFAPSRSSVCSGEFAND